MQNKEIRAEAKRLHVRLWQISEELGMLDSAFSRKLRHELPEEEKTQILSIIQSLSERCDDGK